MKKKLLFSFLKVVIGAALLSFIVWKIGPDWAESKRIVADLFKNRLGFFISGVLCFCVVVLLGTYRWQLLLRAHQVNLRFLEVLKLFFIGHFFSQFMPGGIAGGDIVKSFYISAHTDDRKHEAVTTIFMDRMIGVFGLFGVLIIAIAVNLGSYGYGKKVIFVLIFFAAVALLMLLFFNKGLMKRIPRMTDILDRIPYRDFIARTYNAFHYYKDRKFVLLVTLLFSTIIHVVLAAMVYFVAVGLGLETPFRKYLILVSLVNFVGSIPISPLGTVGTLDGAYVYFFQNETSGKPGILGALALLIRLIYAFWGLIGLFVWLFIKSQMRPAGVVKSDNMQIGKQ